MGDDVKELLEKLGDHPETVFQNSIADEAKHAEVVVRYSQQALRLFATGLDVDTML